MTQNRYLQETQNKKNGNGWPWLLIAILSVMLIRTCNKASDAKADLKTHQLANDTLSRRYNERGEEIYILKSIIKTNEDSYVYELAQKDSIINRLKHK